MVGSVGFALTLYGKKQRRPPQLAAGVLLMVFPYFASSSVPLTVGIAVGILALCWVAVRLGL